MLLRIFDLLAEGRLLMRSSTSSSTLLEQFLSCLGCRVQSHCQLIGIDWHGLLDGAKLGGRRIQIRLMSKTVLLLLLRVNSLLIEPVSTLVVHLGELLLIDLLHGLAHLSIVLIEKRSILVWVRCSII